MDSCIYLFTCIEFIQPLNIRTQERDKLSKYSNFSSFIFNGEISVHSKLSLHANYNNF